ncbi:GntR family transcriptional regulator [Corynebacterium lubricantis]|uniref:GntR family transcriptional regulator n=1 Tax=Corynebacterium lubricantis TaxID=541095 RepID=UPI000360AFFD|nr:GntR family transcriptional regulator [Corynebacterium lubricantis]
MSGKPIYRQIADELRDLIGSGQLAAGDRMPSTNELSKYHSVNPTTSAKALTTLFDEGLLEKRRGLGMFVLPTAQAKVLATRRDNFATDFIRPLLAEAAHLHIYPDQLTAMIALERSKL